MSLDPVYRDALILAVMWLGYFAIHSVLASLRLKNSISSHWPAYMPAYRLTYNFIALALLAPPLLLLYHGQSIILWQFTGLFKWLANGLAIAAMSGFILSLRYYDGQEFIGLRQLRQHETRIEDQEHLSLSPYHCYVRHPWYSFALILIWTRDMNSLLLVTASLMTLYFVVGSRLEEQRLRHYYGNVYDRYCAMVPGLIPLPWKYISQKQAEILLNDYRADKNR